MICLKEKLPLLKKVDVTVIFENAPFGGSMAKRRIDGLADRIVEFVMSFASGLEVVVAGTDSGAREEVIMDVCSDKIEELMASSKKEGLDYDVKGLKFQCP